MAEQLLERGDWEKLVAHVDKLTLNPHERAQKTWILIQTELGDKLDTWDITCFASWFLGHMLPVLPDLKQFCRMLDVKIHQIHYQGDMWKNTDVIRKVNSDSEEGEGIFRGNRTE